VEVTADLHNHHRLPRIDEGAHLPHRSSHAADDRFDLLVNAPACFVAGNRLQVADGPWGLRTLSSP